MMKLPYKLLRKKEVCKLLEYAARTIDEWSSRHDRARQAAGNPLLPSSPRNGLYSVRLGGAAAPNSSRRWDERDILEMLENASREDAGMALLNWRTGL